jgi:hypothetical protein
MGSALSGTLRPSRSPLRRQKREGQWCFYPRYRPIRHENKTAGQLLPDERSANSENLALSGSPVIVADSRPARCCSRPVLNFGLGAVSSSSPSRSPQRCRLPVMLRLVDRPMQRLRAAAPPGQPYPVTVVEPYEIHTGRRQVPSATTRCCSLLVLLPLLCCIVGPPYASEWSVAPKG